jgi:uncharacterized protein YndB with AHSA1/START domain
MTNLNESNADCEIQLSRVFDAPRDLVWKAFTEPEHLAHWWGPQGFTLTTRQRDLRPGGSWSYVMHGPDGHDYENLSTYREVVEPSLLRYSQSGDVESEPVHFEVTVTFEVAGHNRTKLTMTSVFPSKDARDLVVRKYGALEGGRQTLGRLAAHLETMAIDPSVGGSEPFIMTRVFHAPLETVWSAWTEKELLMKWFGPAGVSIPHCSLDLKPGGSFHYCMRGPDGNDLWGKWTFRKIEKPNLLEFIVSFADENGNTIPVPFDPNWPLEMLSVVTFAPHAGIGRGTVASIQWTAFNASEVEQATFDASHNSMQQGWTGTLDQLAEFLAE